MKKILLILSGLICLGTTANAEQLSAIQLLQKVPQWGLVQPGTSCIERYHFLPSGEVLIQSSQERVSGRYSFVSKENGFELPAVVIAFETDNRQPDCAGNKEDQTGTSTTNFLKKESDQRIYFCLDAQGKNCPVYIRPEH